MLNIETLHCVHVVVTLQYLQGKFFWGGVDVLLSFRFLVQVNLLPNQLTVGSCNGLVQRPLECSVLYPVKEELGIAEDEKPQ